MPPRLVKPRTDDQLRQAFADLPYRPERPQQYNPAIGLIGCGGITRDHLKAYRSLNLRVVALCDVELTRAEKRRAEFYPDAAVFRDYRDLLRRDEIEIVDIATHPAERPELLGAAIKAGKHILSQKPFVTDLEVGRRLVGQAERKGVHLAVNQNARWAPHFSYARQAVTAGLLGQITAAALTVHWSHAWVKGTPFEQVRDLILFDYAIHWFDIVRCFLQGAPVRRVYAATAPSPTQLIAPHLLAQVSLEFDQALATLVFHGDTPYGMRDRTYLAGSQASIESSGVNEKSQQLTVHLPSGTWTPQLTGCWFPDGFAGTMGELLCAIEERREPTILARDNLKSLELCFAAVASAHTHQPVVPGQVKRLTG